MPRVTIYVDEELFAAMKDRRLNVSREARRGIRQAIGCDHEEFVCRRCGHEVDRLEVREDALDGYYRDLLWQLTELVDVAGTAEGAARVVKTVGLAHGIPGANRLPLPRASRRRRQQMLEEEAA